MAHLQRRCTLLPIAIIRLIYALIFFSASYPLCSNTALPHDLSDLSLINKIANALVALLLLGTERMGLAETNPAGVRLIVIEALFYGLAIGAVGLRIWSRRLTRRALGLDDYAVVVGLVWVLCNGDKRCD